MGPQLVLRSADLIAERPPGTVDDIHFTESLAASVIGHASRPGDLVLDPFTGYGTTLAVAARMGRRAIGVELVAAHVALARARAGPAVRLIEGDARRLLELVDEPVDLAFTSPPYMAGVAHPENPLSGYATRDGDYATYLAELGSVFGQVAALLRPGGRLVVNAATVIGPDGTTTPLATDLAEVVDARIPLLGVTTLTWDVPPAGLDGDYLLWFEKPRDAGASPRARDAPPALRSSSTSGSATPERYGSGTAAPSNRYATRGRPARASSPCSDPSS